MSWNVNVSSSSASSSELHAGLANDQYSNPKDNDFDLTEDEKCQQTFTFNLLQPQKFWGLNQMSQGLAPVYT